ncbi:hypothetical protein AB9L13_00295 [Desulfovibrio piger]
MAARKKTTEEKNEQQVAATPTEQAAPGQEEGHVEDAREQTPETVETPEAPAAPETDVEALESLSVLADRHRVPSWQQAALCRFMGWAEGKLVSDAEYRDALENLKRRRLCGGRVR